MPGNVCKIAENHSRKLLAQGIIKGKTYRLKSSGKYLSVTDVEENGTSLRFSMLGWKICHFKDKRFRSYAGTNLQIKII